MAENVRYSRIRREIIMTSTEQKKLAAVNADIRGMVQAIKDFKAKRKASIEAKDYETAETMWQNEKIVSQQLAEANHQKIKLYYSKADAVYEDKIISICTLPGLIGMKEANLIECCANINGRKLYAI
nr:MAG TPA: hypothetical protein [Caudoviricetes sp.]